MTLSDVMWRCVADVNASPRLSELHSTAQITVHAIGSVYGTLSVSVQTDIGSGKVMEPGTASIIVHRSGQYNLLLTSSVSICLFVALFISILTLRSWYSLNSPVRGGQAELIGVLLVRNYSQLYSDVIFCLDVWLWQRKSVMQLKNYIIYLFYQYIHRPARLIDWLIDWYSWFCQKNYMAHIL